MWGETFLIGKTWSKSCGVCNFILFGLKAMAPHSSTLAWKIPWTEEPGRVQSMGSWRVGHDWTTSLSLFTFFFFFLFKNFGLPLLQAPEALHVQLTLVHKDIHRGVERDPCAGGHGQEAEPSLFTFMHWRRNWQPTPVFLPGESQERGSLVGCRLCGRTALDTNEET